MANLGKLIKQADAAAESASRLVLRAMREVRGELALLADELNLTGSAADRDKAYQMIQKKMARLSRRLDALMDAQNHLAGKTAAKSAEEMTGLEVKYSAARANAIIELVTPAQGENLAAVFTQNMAQRSINALQEATVAVMREQAVAGGTMKEMKKALGERWQKAISAPPVFTDAGGHTWDTLAYLQMNIRTNTMRVYNDCLVDDVARTTGSDLVRVSTGGDPMCRLCAPWEGVILSVSGKTKGFPTYEQARQAGCFHPNCVHTIETVDDVWDGDEIELQKAHPVTKETATDPDAMDERKYKMDQERYRRKGMDADAARLAVDRDNLETNIRHGLIRSDARAIVDKLTDAQVTALCKDGNPPRFEPTKKATKKDPHAADEKFIRGKRGGVVHISRNATVEDLVRVTRVKAEIIGKKKKDEWTPQTDLEKKTDALMQSIGAKHTDKPLSIDGVNPKYATHDFHYTNNCGRCCDAYEVRSRGYEVIAKGTSGNRRLSPVGDWMQYGNALGGGGWCEMYAGNNLGILFGNSKRKIEREMAKWGNGARAKVFVQWKGGGGHFFVTEQINGSTVFKCPQSGKTYDDTVWNMVKNSRFNAFLRTDNLELNGKIFECIEKP